MNEELRRRWQEWERLPYPASQYPPGSQASQVAGVDLALADGDAAAIFHHFVESGQLPHGEDHLLEVLSALERALPQLRDPGRTYFQEAVELLRTIGAEWARGVDTSIGSAHLRRMSQMRWFTDEAYEAGEEAWKVTLASYQAHAAAIAGSLPPDLAALATDPQLDLHDARIRRVAADRQNGTVSMTVVLGNGRQLRLSFGDATFVPDNLQAVAYAVGATYTTAHWGTAHTEILAHEVDAERDGRYLLRLRLWPFGEFALAFRSFSLTEGSASAGDDGPGEFVFEGGPDED